MARKSRRKHIQRNYRSLQTTFQPRDIFVYRPPLRRLTESYTQIEDHRSIPDVVHEISPSRSLRDIYGGRAETTYRIPARRIPDSRNVLAVQEAVHRYFTVPSKSIVCRRRQARRRVLFSLRKTGYGGRRNAMPKWNARSYIRCGG